MAFSWDRIPASELVRGALLALVLLPALPPGAAEGQRTSVRFRHLSPEQGLSQASVNAVLQDRWGFLWIGTQEGLNRYDGFGFEVFQHDPLDPSSLPHDWIWALHEDRQGNLWLGTDGGGLSRFDPADGSFIHYRNDPANPTTLGNDRVRVIYEDRAGALWVGTDGGGLSRLDPASGRFTRFNHNPSNPASLADDHVRALYEDREGVLWVGTDGGGLDRFDRAQRTFTHFRHDPADPSSLPDDGVRTLFEDADGRLWVGTYQGGLSWLNRPTGTFTRLRHDPADPSSLCHDRVRAVLQDSRSTLWVGTDAGLCEWRPDSESFVRHRHDPADPHSLADDRVVSLYEDRGGVLWVGTHGGLDRWSLTAGAFALYTHDPSSPLSLSSNMVTSFAEGADGVLWVGTYDGLNRVDRKAGSVRQYRHDPADPSSLTDDRVMSLAVDDRGVLWIGTREDGLDRFDPKSGRFTHFRHDPADARSLSADGVTAIFQDSDGVLWVGTYRGGLNRYDPATGGFLHYRHDPANPTSLGSDRVLSVYEDRAGALWIGTDGGGLQRMDRDSGTFTRFRHHPGDPESLGSDVAWTVHEDRSGVLWIGTQGGGLNRWDPADRRNFEPRFRRYGRREGLASTYVYGILEDDEGHLWLSTNMGLFKLDPATETFKQYDTSHGLQGNEFNFGAYLKSASGELFFGGNGGFNAFLPSRLGGNPHPPPVVLTSFLKLNRPVELRAPLWQVDEIELGYRDDVVSFEFAALDFTAPEKNRYRYQLEGFDQEWIDLVNMRRVTYTNLAPGRYRFRVQAANNDGVWNEEGAAVGLLVVPPPWRTWWAYALYTLVAAGAMVLYTRAQASKLEREAEHSRRLEDEVEVRTQELAERNRELEELNRKLEEASLTDSLTGLRNRRYVLTHIDEDLALLRRHRAQPPSKGPRPDLLFLMLDLDGLKEINDTYGHAAGDQVLIQICDLLKKICRKSDTLIRWGGDEFLIVGRQADRVAAESLAERIRCSVAEHDFEVGGEETAELSCSIGFAFYPFESARPQLLSWEQVVTVADRALYVAKHTGRNAWVGILSATPDPPEDLLQRIDREPELLAREGVIELHTSIPSGLQLVWSRS